MYTLTFTEEQMAVLDKALQEVPFRFSAPIIRSINEQIMKAQALKPSDGVELDVDDSKAEA